MDRSFGGIVLAAIGVVTACVVLSACSEREPSSANDFLSDRAVDSLLTLSKKYPVKSAVITYRLNGLDSGLHRLYIEDYGMRTVSVRDTDFRFGIDDWTDPILELRRAKYSISKGLYSYTIELENGRATRRLRSAAKLVRELGRAFTPEDWQAFKNGLARQTKSGTDTLLGRTCEVWYYPDHKATSWRWNGINIAWKEHISDNPDRIALEIQENPEIPDSMFVIPEGLEFEDQPAEGIE